MAARPVVTWVLLAILGVVFVLLMVLADLLSARFHERVPYEALVLLGAKNRDAIDGGQFWRFGTSVLLHGNLLHLLMNSYALYVLGTVLERLYGVRRFLALFIVAGLGGAVASYLFTDANSVGASGAIFGLLGGAVVFGIKFRGSLPARIRHMLTLGLLPWVVLNVFIGSAVPGIDNAAHMGGLVTGSVLAVVLGSRLRESVSTGARAVLAAVLAAGLVYMGYSVVAAPIDTAPCTRDIDALEACALALTPEDFQAEEAQE